MSLFETDSRCRGRPELADELYRRWLELEQRGLKKSPEYRNVMLRADRQAWWLAGLARPQKPRFCAAFFSQELERNTLSAPQEAA
jgi:hypothetical protein